MYKIWINEKFICLIHHRLKSFLPQDDKASLVLYYSDKPKFLLSVLDKLNKSEVNRIYVLSHDVSKLKEDFFSLFTEVKAAGGLVFNAQQKVLFIYRRGAWDLPKGKLDAGEKKKAGAIREVLEETGLESVKLIKKLGTTYHVYGQKEKNKKMIKSTSWYLMQGSESVLKPQYEEDIEKAEWKNIHSVVKGKLNPIYGSIMDIVHAYSDFLKTISS